MSGPAPTPEEIGPAFDSAMNRGDVDGLMALFHPDAVMRMAEGAVIDAGPEALREALGDLIAARVTLQNQLRRILISGDIALLLLDWESRVPGPDGQDIIDQGVATQVAERVAEQDWRLRIANPLGVR
ncbi:hypothetical protein AA23498_2119 [Acetobacter nitrogenifigens DSM 23921 = NBRC 105050]|uniref:SnoaL-like domain-containing protein n=1 Tax=Acetobacter nitrogenifigens DSM 23921 = NBRC 105050 TaxID=1120919 RepID=A0A511XFR4_9PROT|nr:nuclear transport factor 2 family protein [Acetobacter nitrogenifigens]GBQ94802.1 hypothetical protein AA23498_2119 [Acetobacter nitrogenifigens DSM 23921 = NBRC 105050]GEN61755.1 hypothetical protein ANI02nite_36390 [Acetobacter nitrogenifigens DSM 23921 = NBRC 105050]